MSPEVTELVERNNKICARMKPWIWGGIIVSAFCGDIMLGDFIFTWAENSYWDFLLGMLNAGSCFINFRQTRKNIRFIRNLRDENRWIIRLDQSQSASEIEMCQDQLMAIMCDL